MNSLVTLMANAVDIGGSSEPGVVGSNPNARPGDTATSFYPSRGDSQKGSVQIQISGDPDPSAGSTGLVRIEGRLTPSHGWAVIQSFDISTADGTDPWARIITLLPMIYEMRINVVEDGGTYDVDSGTTLYIAFQQ